MSSPKSQSHPSYRVARAPTTVFRHAPFTVRSHPSFRGLSERSSLQVPPSGMNVESNPKGLDEFLKERGWMRALSRALVPESEVDDLLQDTAIVALARVRRGLAELAARCDAASGCGFTAFPLRAPHEGDAVSTRRGGPAGSGGGPARGTGRDGEPSGSRAPSAARALSLRATSSLSRGIVHR